MENDCDELSVLYLIYKEIQNKYLCEITYYDETYGMPCENYMYLSRNTIESKIAEDLKYDFKDTHSYNLENMFNTLNDKLFYNKYIAKRDGFDDFLNTNLIAIHKEEVNYDCEYLIIEIQHLIDKYISENKQYQYKVILNSNTINIMEAIDKRLYIPYNNNSNISGNEIDISITEVQQEPFINEEVLEVKDAENEIIYTTKFTTSQLQTIFDRLIDREYLYKETKFEDFQYVFCNTTKPNDFNKLVWLVKGRNKDINKKLLIAFCMEIFDLELKNIDKDFFKWGYDRFYTKKIFGYNNKPDDNNIDKKNQLDQIFSNI